MELTTTIRTEESLNRDVSFVQLLQKIAVASKKAIKADKRGRYPFIMIIFDL